MEKDIVAKWLKQYVGPDNFCEFFWGWYDFKDMKVVQNVGAVYGIWLKSVKTEIRKYEEEHHVSLKDFAGYRPLYWGKDVSPCSRISAHFDSSASTGALNLVYSNYASKDLIFGCVLTKEYTEIEKRLHKDYPPLEGSNREGRSSTVRKILK